MHMFVQTALESQLLSCTHLAHDELKRVIVIVTITTTTTTTTIVIVIVIVIIIIIIHDYHYLLLLLLVFHIGIKRNDLISVIRRLSCTFAAACWVIRPDTNQIRSSAAKLKLAQASSALMQSQWAIPS